MYSHYEKHIVVPQKLKIELSYDPEMLLDIYTYIYIWLHESQEVEATKVFLIRWLNEQNVVYTHMQYYSDLKRKDILTHATTWMKLEDITLNEISHSQKDKYHIIPFIWGLYGSQIHKKKEGRRVVSRSWGEREMGSCLMSIDFQFCKMKKFWRLFAQQCEYI